MRAPISRSRRGLARAAWPLVQAFTILAMLAGQWPWFTPLVVTAALAVVTTSCARAFRRAVGGVTGDLLGAAEQIAEITAGLALLAALRF